MSVTGSTGTRVDSLFARARATRGFMPDDEGEALYEAARSAGVEAVAGESGASFVEIGAWCGKSTLYLGAAAEETGALLFSVDHHHGSEENGPGWPFYDPDLVSASSGRIDTLPHWRAAIEGAGLESSVVALVGDSPGIASHWGTPLAFCFIDGGHGAEPAWADYRGWAPHVAPGGLLAIHDVFSDPEDGGRPPYEIWCDAVASKTWEPVTERGSLRVLRRTGPTGASRSG